MIECPIHGFSYKVNCSPDICKAIELNEQLPSFRDILYYCDGDPCQRVVVSEKFAMEYDISDSLSPELPEYYPSWHKILLVFCEICVDFAIESS